MAARNAVAVDQVGISPFPLIGPQDPLSDSLPKSGGHFFNLVQNTLSVRPFHVGPGFGRNDPGGVSPDGGRERAHLNSEGVAARGRLLTRDQERPGSLSGATRSENKQTGRMLAITARPALNTPPDAVRTPRARPDPWQWMSPATRASSAHP
ncbi:MAG: hypothetical protein M0Z53_06620 [Thermaerobacter sp.]|nr:hypothetical protein [Thermaerobacter sp.]